MGLGRRRGSFRRGWVTLGLVGLLFQLPARAEPVSLQALVTPSTVILKDGNPVPFAVHGFIEFKSLAELFPYIESQTARWKTRADFGDSARRDLGRDLLRRGIESRVVSMADERPLETLITHTREELVQALAQVKEPTPPGYADAFLVVQEKWKHFAELLERRALDSGARALELVSDRRGDQAVWRDLRFDGTFLAGYEISP